MALGGVVGVDAYVLSRQICRQESHRIRASPQLHAHVANRLGEGAVSAFLVERERHALTANHLIADENLDATWINSNAAGADGRQDPPPVGIGTRPGRLDQRGVSDRAGYV